MDDATSENDEAAKQAFADWVSARSNLEKLGRVNSFGDLGIFAAVLQAFVAGWKAAEGANAWSDE